MRSDAYPAYEPFREEYTPEFVGRWDELINWEGRRRSEQGFFEQILSENGVGKVLDIACGTGYHTITLTQSGFDVMGADGAAADEVVQEAMLAVWRKADTFDPSKDGFILVGETDILKKICPQHLSISATFIEIENKGFCMFGNKK
mgnify:CR=1 FL=1